MTAIQEQLFLLQDTQYRDFQVKLMPTVSTDTVIGVRTPALRAMAKKLAKTEEAQEFLKETPHAYFEENQLHAFLIAGEKDFEICMEELEQFLPYIDNWATCDQISPGVFRKHREELLPYIDRWISSGHTYTVRFAIGMLMQHFLDEAFEATYAERVAAVRSEEYYVNMMIAWYFATALAKQYEAVLPFLEEGRLERWTHNKTIQKAVENYRITPEQKVYLKTLRRPLVSHIHISL
ncbi:MAG: DNA alkylation repair protein [Clostridiales bacterium]|nr:DNA alkylation repair protein [Clostridiales bacterium]